MSEERVHLATPPYRGSFFLIDPLDGTKEYVAGRNEFTVNVALVTDGSPLLGIIAAPALGLIWRGLVGQGAERLTATDCAGGPAKSIHTRHLPRRERRGSPPSAALTATPEPRPLSMDGQEPSGRRSARRSNLAGSPKAPPTSIPALPRPANGISPPATPSSPPPGARSRMAAARVCASATAARTSLCRNSLPGAILRPRADKALSAVSRRADRIGPSVVRHRPDKQ